MVKIVIKDLSCFACYFRGRILENCHGKWHYVNERSPGVTRVASWRVCAARLSLSGTKKEKKLENFVNLTTLIGTNLTKIWSFKVKKALIWPNLPWSKKLIFSDFSDPYWDFQILIKAPLPIKCYHSVTSNFQIFSDFKCAYTPQLNLKNGRIWLKFGTLVPWVNIYLGEFSLHFSKILIFRVFGRIFHRNKDRTLGQPGDFKNDLIWLRFGTYLRWVNIFWM